MIITKQAIARKMSKDAVKWFLKHRKPITRSSLKPILVKHLTPEIGIEEMTDFLLTPKGQRVWHKAMRDELKAQG